MIRFLSLHISVFNLSITRLPPLSLELKEEAGVVRRMQGVKITGMQ